MTAPRKRAARTARTPAPARRQKTPPVPDRPAESPPKPAVTARPAGISPTAGALVPAAGPEALCPPVRLPQEHHLDSGLVDYGMWIRMFGEAPSVPAPPEGYRRGRIWA